MTDYQQAQARQQAAEMIGMWPYVPPGKSVTEWFPVTTREEAVRLLSEDFGSSPYGWATWELGLPSEKAQVLAAIGGVAALRA